MSLNHPSKILIGIPITRNITIWQCWHCWHIQVLHIVARGYEYLFVHFDCHVYLCKPDFYQMMSCKMFPNQTLCRDYMPSSNSCIFFQRVNCLKVAFYQQVKGHFIL